MLHTSKLRAGVVVTLALGLTVIPALTSSTPARQDRDPGTQLELARHGENGRISPCSPPRKPPVEGLLVTAPFRARDAW
jgi:hypothetical protein